MSHSEDHTFIRRFSGIIIGLVLLTIVLVFVARSWQFEPDVDANPSQRVLAHQRISPVSGVRTSKEEAVVPDEVPVSPAAEQSAVPAVDGEQVYNGLCMACHVAGVAGTPITGSDQMAERLSERGFDTLVTNAINGINTMPPRGGNPGLTDEQVRAAVEFMLP